ncbi:MAG: pilus assembly protein PilM [Oscillospiraceae bacterium]|nr:pilus assembly protein PilM [Oscillospiraceae bacterium]
MLSIDITDRQIKLVRGVHSGNKIRIQDADMRELSPGMVSNGYVTDVPMVAAELNDIIKTRDIKEKEAIVSITSSSIVYKEMTIAKPKNMKNAAVIEAMIQSEMNVTSEFNISFTIAGETEDEEKNKMLKVIAAACPQRLVDGYTRLFSHIGLQLKGVSISNNSVTRLITNTPKMADRMPMLLIQIDKNFLNMNLYENNQLAFSRFSNIDPNDYENAPDYVTRAVYDNLFRMIQFIRQRKNTKPLQEILFYGEIDSFIEISNAISSFNVPSNMLSMPTSIVTTAQFDFTKYANAIGALYRRNKELEHINLLEATSAKESKGSSGTLLAFLGTIIASAAVVGAVYMGVTAYDSKLHSDIDKIQTQIDDPKLKNDCQIVDDREVMLAGFNSYNSTVKSAVMLFNYQPKAQSLVVDKLREPLPKLKNANKYGTKVPSVSVTDAQPSEAYTQGNLDYTGSILKENEFLDIQTISIQGDTVNISFRGLCKGDPSSIPSRYANYLTNNVLNKYGQPYFTNVEYTGFAKDNISDFGTLAILLDLGRQKEVAANVSADKRLYPGEPLPADKKYDTIFSFEINMKLQPGSDELHTDIDKDIIGDAADTEVAE